MKTLIAHPFYAAPISDDSVFYQPTLLSAGEAALKAALTKEKPNFLIVGSNEVSPETLRAWRMAIRNDVPLSIIRRGTSLAAIDVDCAKQLHIQTFNTPGVNAPYIADYISQKLALSAQNSKQKICVLGSGRIGARVARRAAELGYEVSVYSPSLRDVFARDALLKKKNLVHPLIRIENSAEEAARNANFIAITAGASSKKPEKISAAFVDLIPKHTKIVSVSDSSLFSDTALHRLFARHQVNEISLSMDSSLSDIARLRKLSAGFSTLPHFSSEAMNDPRCQRIMDYAVAVMLADLCTQRLLAKGIEFSATLPPIHRAKAVTVIGAGFSGLMSALLLRQKGYRVHVVDAHPDPRSANQNTYQESASWDGDDARHISASETLPHASEARAHVLSTPIAQGGWKMRSEFSAAEKEWMERFNEMAASPELHALCSRFVANLNRYGMRAWDQFFAAFPEFSREALRDQRIVRFYTSEAELEAGYHYQRKLHYEDNSPRELTIRKLSREETAKRFPGVSSSALVGAIEVDAKIVNAKRLAECLREFLEKNDVQFSWQNRVASLPSSPTVISTGAHTGALLENTDMAHKVQGVMGCWITLPNVDGISSGFKIHEKEPIGVINITPSADKRFLYVSGGFGYVGEKTPNLNDPATEQFFQLFERTIARALPNGFSAAQKAGTLHRKFCVRPMSADGVPFLHSLINHPNATYVGGTNSGGFVEAPVLSAMVAVGMDEKNMRDRSASASHYWFSRALSADRVSLAGR